MTPYLSNDRGTFPLDRLWHGVRIVRASGTVDPELFAAINRALTELKRSHDIALSIRLAVWGEIASGTRHPMQFYEQFRRLGVMGLKTGPTGLKLTDALQQWLDQPGGPTTRRGVPLAATTVESYRLHLVQHLITLHPTATLADVPDLVRQVRERAPSGTASVTRTAVQALVRWKCGRHSDLWRAVSDVNPPAVQDHDRQGLSIDEAREKAVALGQDGLYWWTLCTTGMRVKREYLARHAPLPWVVHLRPPHIEIPASKTKAGRRLIPLVATPARCPHSYTWLAERLRTVDVTAHIARYTYKRILEESGIPPARVDLYLGHSMGGLKVYGRHDVMHYLLADIGLIQAKLGPEPRQMRVVG